MHSRATDRRSASKCQGKWPDQTLDQAFGLPRCWQRSAPRVCLARGPGNANIDAGWGFIWRISANGALWLYSRGVNEAFFADLSARLTQAGLAGASETDIVSGFCDRCVAAGLPLARVLLFI